MNSSQWLLDRTASTPEQTAVIFNYQQFSYADLTQRTMDLLGALQARKGVQHIAVIASNSMDTIALIHAFTMSRHQLFLLNTRLSAEEIQWQLDRVHIDLVIISSQHHNIVSTLTDVEISTIDELKHDSDHQPEITAHQQTDVLCTVFTSGTTGKPKAVPLTFGNFFYSAMASAYHLGTVAEDVWLLTIPIYHLGGLSIIFRSCLYGITILCHDGFDIPQIVRDLNDHRITLMSLVPAMLRRLLPEIPATNSLRVVLVGGAALPVPLHKQAIALSVPVATTYGMTETTSQFATARPDQAALKPGMVGKPLFGSSLQIFQPDESGIGEIAVKGPTVMTGYLFADTNRTEDGFLLTGDIGYVDDDGDLFVLQRRRDLIISGGENIYPKEVEQALLAIAAIDDACVVGIEDDQWGQVPVAIIQTRDDLTKEQLIKILRSKLAGYKIPRTYYLIDQLPRNTGGKVDRRQVYQMIEDGLPVLS